MHLYKTRRGAIVQDAGACYLLAGAEWDYLVNRDGLAGWLAQAIRGVEPLPKGFDPLKAELEPPIGSQEVWAAGVTYYRSRVARMEEADKAAPGGSGASFYDKVYDADRPELFFKATPHRVVGHGGKVRIRRDSAWNVPEPELTLVVNSKGRIIGYTVGNDMSSRDIEGANPLYLPQAKVYRQSCALGPGIVAADGPLPGETRIELNIARGGAVAFTGAATLGQMKRRPEELVEWLFRDNSFPNGCFLLTGTGIVPPEGFSLAWGDEVRIEIAGVGALVNTVE